MISLNMELHSDKLMDALLRMPHQLEKNMDRAIERIVQEMARDARRNAPKAASTLVQSIHVERPSPLEGIVAPSVHYAQMVEEGTGLQGPFGKASGVMPPVQNILDWIETGSGVSANDPSYDNEDLAWAIARSIAKHGTAPQPFMAPALESNRTRAERRINQAIEKTLSGGG